MDVILREDEIPQKRSVLARGAQVEDKNPLLSPFAKGRCKSLFLSPSFVKRETGGF
jgi:hypothetical protein